MIKELEYNVHREVQKCVKLFVMFMGVFDVTLENSHDMNQLKQNQYYDMSIARLYQNFGFIQQHLQERIDTFKKSERIEIFMCSRKRKSQMYVDELNDILDVHTRGAI
jgi:hypothetical protein